MKKQWPHVLWFVFFLNQVTIARAAETVLHLVLIASGSNVSRFEFASYSDSTGVNDTKLERITSSVASDCSCLQLSH